MKNKNIAAVFAILAAALYAINVPISKMLISSISPTMMAAFLYLGAGIGMLIYVFTAKALKREYKKEPLTKKELPYTIAMILLDIAAPILLMAGIAKTTSSNVSLLNNFEIVATSIIALAIFKEVISKKLWLAILLVTVSSIILSFEGNDGFVFNSGSLMVLGACVCWGFENNATKMISNKSSEEIVIIKGIFSGVGSLIVGLIIGENLPDIINIFKVMILGFVAYGLSINFYIMAQKDLGAAKTSAYYSIAPFLGVAFSIILLGEALTLQFCISFALMIIAAVIMVRDTIELQHTHEHIHTHCHSHRHGDIVHTHQHSHKHTHTHIHMQGESSSVHSHKHKELTDHNHCHNF